jgi:hypothetical protein
MICRTAAVRPAFRRERGPERSLPRRSRKNGIGFSQRLITFQRRVDSAIANVREVIRGVRGCWDSSYLLVRRG